MDRYNVFSQPEILDVLNYTSKLGGAASVPGLILSLVYSLHVRFPPCSPLSSHLTKHVTLKTLSLGVIGCVNVRVHGAHRPFYGVFLPRAKFSYLTVLWIHLDPDEEKVLTENEWTSEICTQCSWENVVSVFPFTTLKWSLDSSWFTRMDLSLFFEAVMVEDVMLLHCYGYFILFLSPYSTSCLMYFVCRGLMIL